MAKGKQPESEALKAAFELYRNLSETDQQTFRTKEFTTMIAGLSEEVKKDFRKQRETLLSSIKAQKDLQVKVDGLKDIPASVLEAALKAKKQAK